MNWSFHLRDFVEGQELSGILDGSNLMLVVPQSTNKDKVSASPCPIRTKIVQAPLQNLLMKRQ